MNTTILTGRLTKKPELRYSQNNNAIGRFTLAVDRPHKTDQEQTADFINIVTFGKQAESCEKYLDKASKVAVQGHIQTGKYEKDGQTRFTFDVVADRVEFLDNKKKIDGDQQQSSNDDGIPEGFQAVSSEDIPF